MTRVLVVAAVALAAVVVYSATAPAGQQAVTPQQFKALQKRVAKLEKDTKNLTGVVLACVFDKGAIPTTKAPQYHVTGAGEATDFYVLSTNNQECVTFINSPLTRGILRRAGG